MLDQTIAAGAAGAVEVAVVAQEIVMNHKLNCRHQRIAETEDYTDAELCRYNRSRYRLVDIVMELIERTSEFG